MDVIDRFKGCLLGLAVGDAVGTALEFQPRGSFTPISDLVGGGPFHLRPGEWTDDTSMALCLATSLVEMGKFDARDQMDRYCRWEREGYLSSNGQCFDIGFATAAALRRYQETDDPLAGSADPQSAGNGCIMRLAPIPMFYYPDLERAKRYAAESSRTTHGAAECLDACRVLGAMIVRALDGCSKEEVLSAEADTSYAEERISALARGEYRDKTIDHIRGSGYVVESLEAALWCFSHADSFRKAVLMAANLGDDADTTAAVCGQIAGAFYGASGIPASWLEKLAMREEIEDLARRVWEGSLIGENNASR